MGKGGGGMPNAGNQVLSDGGIEQVRLGPTSSPLPLLPPNLLVMGTKKKSALVPSVVRWPLVRMRSSSAKWRGGRSTLWISRLRG